VSELRVRNSGLGTQNKRRGIQPPDVRAVVRHLAAQDEGYWRVAEGRHCNNNSTTNLNNDNHSDVKRHWKGDEE
jgi:hypothetical protein